jgi:hypothetical protein
MMNELPVEVQRAMYDMHCLTRQVGDVLVLAAQQSEELARFSTATRETGARIGTAIARVSFDANNLGGSAEGAILGMAVAGGAHVIGKALQWGGQVVADIKKDRALTRLLATKQEIARLKAPVLREALLRMDKHREMFLGLLSSDAPMAFRDEIDRLIEIQSSIDALFRGLVEVTQGTMTARFLLREFEAWLDGSQTSNTPGPDASVVVVESVDLLLRWSKLPSSSSTSAFSVDRELSAGTAYLLTRNDLAPIVRRFPQLRCVVSALANRRVATLLVPFGRQAKTYGRLHVGVFGQSALVRRATRVRIFAVATCFATLVLGGWLVIPGSGMGAAAVGASPAVLSVTSVVSATPAPAAAPLPDTSPVNAATTASPTTKRPSAVALPAASTLPPVSRAACLKACVTKCNDDASCERSCAATCPH